MMTDYMIVANMGQREDERWWGGSKDHWVSEADDAIAFSDRKHAIEDARALHRTKKARPGRVASDVRRILGEPAIRTIHVVGTDGSVTEIA